MSMSPAPQAPSTGRCPVCASPITEEQDPQVCERCDTPHHRDCWSYVGHCAVFGCHVDDAVPALAEKDLTSLRTSLDRWLWTYRAYAIALAFVGIALSGAFFFPAFSLFLRHVVGMSAHAPLFRALGEISLVAVLLSGLAVVVFGLPMAFAQMRVSSLLDTPAPQRPRDRHALLNRLELGGLSGWVYRRATAFGLLLDWTVQIGRITFIPCLFLLLIPLWGFDPLSAYGVSLFSFTAATVLGLCAAPLQVARQRLAYLATVQNRCALGWKGKD